MLTKLFAALMILWSLAGSAIAGPDEDAVRDLLHSTFDKPEVLTKAASMSFQWTAVLPLVLIVLFGILWLRDRARGGYKAVRLTGPEPEPQPEKAKV